MTPAEARSGLVALLAQIDRGGMSIKDAGREFERLTYLLEGVSRDDDARLRSLVNEIELIRFGRLPERQMAAVAAVLRKAEPIFNRAAR